MALAETGEAALVYCSSCDYAANDEAASTVVPRPPTVTEAVDMQKVHTPGLKTIAELADAFELAEHDTVKTMVGSSAGGLVFFLVPGDRELNPLKAERVAPGVRLLEEDDFEELGLPKGSLGPVAPPDGTRIGRGPESRGRGLVQRRREHRRLPLFRRRTGQGLRRGRMG